MKNVKTINEFFGPDGYYYTERISDNYINIMRNLGIPSGSFEEVYASFMKEITDENVVQFTFTDWLDNEDNYIDYLK